MSIHTYDDVDELKKAVGDKKIVCCCRTEFYWDDLFYTGEDILHFYKIAGEKGIKLSLISLFPDKEYGIKNKDNIEILVDLVRGRILSVVGFPGQKDPSGKRHSIPIMEMVVTTTCKYCIGNGLTAWAETYDLPTKEHISPPPWLDDEYFYKYMDEAGVKYRKED